MKHFATQNRVLLNQLQDLLRQCTEEEYQFPGDPGFQASIGDHLRHTLDHYRCFLEGLETGKVNYDHRNRESSLARDLDLALEELHRVAQSLEAIAGTKDGPLAIVPENLTDRPLPSSRSRELAFLVSHTVHHCALIRPLCRRQELEVPESFGVAPSTLKFKASQGA